MINLRDPLAVLATRLPWTQIEALLAPKFEHLHRAGDTLESSDLLSSVQVVVGAGQSFTGRPKLPIHLMASLVYLKHSYNLSDEELVARWSENVLWQFFSGMEYYEHRQPCDPTQIGRFRRDIGEDGMELLLKATIDTAVAINAVKPKELERVIVDTTVKEKAIAHPVDSRLLACVVVDSYAFDTTHLLGESFGARHAREPLVACRARSKFQLLFLGLPLLHATCPGTGSHASMSSSGYL